MARRIWTLFARGSHNNTKQFLSRIDFRVISEDTKPRMILVVSNAPTFDCAIDFGGGRRFHTQFTVCTGTSSRLESAQKVGCVTTLDRAFSDDLESCHNHEALDSLAPSP